MKQIDKILLKDSRGTVLAEILIVLAIIGIIAGVVLPQLSIVKEDQILGSGIENIVTVLHTARSQSLASIGGVQYGVRFESDKVILFQGEGYIEGGSGNKIINLDSSTRISNVRISGVDYSSGEIYFDRLSGVPSASTSITVSTSSYSKIITVSLTGAVNIN